MVPATAPDTAIEPQWIDDLCSDVAQCITTPEIGFHWAVDQDNLYTITVYPASLDHQGLAVYDAMMEFDLDAIREIAGTVNGLTATQKMISFDGIYDGHEYILDLLFAPPHEDEIEAV